MFKFGIGGKIAAGLSLVIAVLCGIGYWYYTNTQDTIQRLTSNNAKLETAIQISERTISDLQSDYSKINAVTRQLNDQLSQTRTNNQILLEKLQEHELGYLASEKPRLVENTINNASDNAARCFELMSGAPLTEKEKSAQNPNDFNSECPWMWEQTR